MNLKEALLCSRICRLTYVTDYEFSNFEKTAQFSNSGTDTQGIIGVAFGKSLVIGFRGSEETSLSDWVTDLKFVQDDYPFIKGRNDLHVHHGFVWAYTSVRDAILEQVKGSDYDNVICTGHSLGGALSVLCALDVAHNLGKSLACYTMGAPKVGNKAFVDLYNKTVPETHRVVNGSDKIPSIPPGDYYHAGKLHETGSKASGVIASIQDTFGDHLPNSYIRELQAELTGE